MTGNYDGDPEYRAPRLWPATSLRPATQPRWLAKGRLPYGAISLLVGDEGIGKSLLWVWLAAAVTTGRPLPEFGVPPRDPAPVVVVVTEDDWASTVRPRLEVAGADLNMVSVICTDDDGSGAPTFPEHLYLVVDADPAPALVVVDAWLDTVPSNLNVQRPQDARRALHPWREAATATDAAVLLLTHTNRMQTGDARSKYGASGELRKKARMALYAQQDEDGALLVGPEKSNTTKLPPASRFTIESVRLFAETDDHDGTVPKLVCLGDSDRTARDHLADAYERAQADRDGDLDDRTAAEVWLTDYLTEHDWADSADAKRDGAKALRVSEKTIQRAATRLSVRRENRDFPRRTHWSLPDAVGVDSGDSVDTDIACSSETVPTVPTVDDLGKRRVRTGTELQYGQTLGNRDTGVPTGPAPESIQSAHIHVLPDLSAIPGGPATAWEVPANSRIAPGHHTPIVISERRGGYRAVSNYMPTAGGPRDRVDKTGSTPRQAWDRCRAKLLDHLSTDTEAAQ